MAISALRELKNGFGLSALVRATKPGIVELKGSGLAVTGLRAFRVRLEGKLQHSAHDSSLSDNLVQPLGNPKA